MRAGFGAAAAATAGLLAVAALAGPATSQAARAGGPQGLAESIAANDAELRGAIDEWRRDAGDPPAGQAPARVIAPALALQRQVRYMARHPNAAEATIALLAPGLAGRLRQLTAAARSLRRLAGGSAGRRVRVGKPRPLAELLGHYETAEGRYGTASEYLAAINLVETKFGRVKSKSVSGARGPMQFIPSTWRIYGRGADIHDPHDAILAAARLLRATGAPASYARALYAYNPSKLYVAAVSRYAKLIARDPYAIAYLYCWGP